MPRGNLFFDKDGASRKASGSKGGHIYRNANNSNELVIILKWDNLEKARTFVQSDGLKNVMEQASVADKPDIYFLDEIEEVKA